MVVDQAIRCGRSRAAAGNVAVSPVSAECWPPTCVRAGLTLERRPIGLNRGGFRIAVEVIQAVRRMEPADMPRARKPACCAVVSMDLR
jgi:hypothetical protein